MVDLVCKLAAYSVSVFDPCSIVSNSNTKKIVTFANCLVFYLLF
jgi:hypothetical protein